MPARFSALRLFRAGDILVLLLCIAAAVLCLAFPGSGRGAVAEVRTPTETVTMDLSRTQTLQVTGQNGYTLILETDGSRVRVQDADCPDRLCVHMGWLQKAGQSAACLPAGVTVTVYGDKDADTPDAIAR